MRHLLLALLLLPASGSTLAAQAGTVILVRHGEKGDTTADPPLSEAGAQRARALDAALARFPLAAIYVSEYRRTGLTAAAVAARTGLLPVTIPVRKQPAAQAAAIAEAVRQLPRGSAALVVGHSNTLPAILRALGGPEIPDLCDAEYATLLLLELPGEGLPPRLLRVSYGGANPIDTDGCLSRMRLE